MYKDNYNMLCVKMMNAHFCSVRLLPFNDTVNLIVQYHILYDLQTVVSPLAVVQKFSRNFFFNLVIFRFLSKASKTFFDYGIFQGIARMNCPL